jgi:hypothetical protein
MHAYDRALFRRALLAIAVLTLLATATVMATDEATSTAAMRLARISALSPFVSAIALLGIAAHARSRGELSALEALGTSPWRTVLGVELAGVVAAVASVVALLLPFTDARSLFPAVHPVVDWRMAADGLRAVAPGIVVHADGVIETTGSAFPRPSLAVPAWAAAPCIGSIAGIVPAWSATPMSLARRLSSGGGSVALAVVGLHLVAAGRLSPLVATVACAPVGVALWFSRRVN